MSVQALIQDLEREGVTLSIIAEGQVAVDGPRAALDRWLPEVRSAKPELLALLSGPEPPPLSPADNDAIREAIEERAAIREIDGGESRQVAEREARSAMRVYQYRLTDRPDTWLTMLAPECDLDEARRSLALRFGPERLIEVREHRERAA